MAKFIYKWQVKSEYWNPMFKFISYLGNIKNYCKWLFLHRFIPLRKKTFLYSGRKYRYFIHPYNQTWNNERCVEIPIIWNYLSQYDPTRILELGNVLSHYFQVFHDIIDLYEEKPTTNIINQDIVNFHSKKKYDLIICISTLEHIGWDDKPCDPGKPLLSITKIRSLLSPDGLAIFTIPIGYNPNVDVLLYNKGIFTRVEYLARVSKDNEWMKTSQDQAHICKYGYPFSWANAVAIAYLISNPAALKKQEI
jgi:hypothetical protein